MSRLTVGLGIGADAVRAVGIVRGLVRWAVQVERGRGEPVRAALDALLAKCPRPRWSRPASFAAIGPAAAHLRCVTGLPQVSDAGALAAIVRESARRFFPVDGTPVVTTGVRATVPGTAWAAALRADVVSDLEQACRSARLRLRAIVPAAIALVHACSDHEVSWSDGDIREAIEVRDVMVASVRRVGPAAPDDGRPLTLAPPLAVLGARARDYADAYGAVLVPRDETVVYRPGARPYGAFSSRTSLIAGSTAVAAALVVCAAGPPAVQAWTARGIERQLAAGAARQRTIRSARANLERMDDALQQMARFDAHRRSALLLLRDLARVLPRNAALVALRVDSAGGELVAVAPEAAGVIRGLERVPGLASPAIVGPVTSETLGTSQLQRFTVRFVLGAAPPRQSVSSTGRAR